MKAIVLHEYGGPHKLKYEDVADPKPGPGEVLVRTTAASVNPVDYKMRSGAAKDHFPVEFPAILGRDVAGLVRALGEDVTGFEVGERVMALTWHTYAELVVVKASDLAKVPEGLDLAEAGALPLAILTGDQLIHKAAKVKAGETVLITGAVGSVGRVAVYAALQLGAKVIAGVRRKQLEEARALGLTEALAIDDADAMKRLGIVDAVADMVGGPLATELLGKVKQGGTFGSLLGVPKDATLHPTVQVNAITAEPNAKTIEEYATAVRDKKLTIPIDRMLPLAEAAEAHIVVEKGGIAKVVLLA